MDMDGRAERERDTRTGKGAKHRAAARHRTSAADELGAWCSSARAGKRGLFLRVARVRYVCGVPRLRAGLGRAGRRCAPGDADGAEWNTRQTPGCVRRVGVGCSPRGCHATTGRVDPTGRGTRPVPRRPGSTGRETIQIRDRLRSVLSTGTRRSPVGAKTPTGRCVLQLYTRAILPWSWASTVDAGANHATCRPARVASRALSTRLCGAGGRRVGVGLDLSRSSTGDPSESPARLLASMHAPFGASPCPRAHTSPSCADERAPSTAPAAAACTLTRRFRRARRAAWSASRRRVAPAAGRARAGRRAPW